MIKKIFLFIAICSVMQIDHASHMGHQGHNKRHKNAHGSSGMSHSGQVMAQHPIVTNNGQVQNGAQPVGQQPSTPQVTGSTSTLNNFMQTMGGMPATTNQQQVPMPTGPMPATTNQHQVPMPTGPMPLGMSPMLQQGPMGQMRPMQNNNYAYRLINQINTLVTNIKFFKTFFKNTRESLMGKNNKQVNPMGESLIHMIVREQLNDFRPDRNLLTEQGVTSVDINSAPQNMINPLTGMAVTAQDVPMLKKYKAVLYELAMTELSLVTLWEAYKYDIDAHPKSNEELVPRGGMSFYRGDNAMRPVAVKAWNHISNHKTVFNN